MICPARTIPFSNLTCLLNFSFGPESTFQRQYVKQHPELSYRQIADQLNTKAFSMYYIEENLARPFKVREPPYDAESFRQEIRDALVFVLNHDEHLNPRTRENGSVAEEISASAQDIDYAPEDAYQAFLWIWEALHGSEDWHADITGWVLD